jgi:hypothetical protein
MKNIMKILFGLILSLSVVQFANAGELSVTGNVQATYTITSSDSTTAQVEKKPGIGMSNEIALGAKGEFANGLTWNYQVELDSDQRNGAAINDDTRLEIGTPYGTIGIYNSEGDLNTQLKSSVAAYAPGHDIGTSGGYEGGTGMNSYSNIQYHTPAGLLPYGTSIKLATSSGQGYGGDANDSGAANTTDGAESYQITASPVDGMTVGASYLEKKGTETAVKQKYETGGLFVKYNTGPVALGIGRHGVAPNIGGDSSGTCAVTTAVKSYSTSVSATTGLPSTTTSYCSGTSHFINTAMSVAYAVNDNLSVSFDRMKSTAHVDNTSVANVKTETNRDLQVDSIQAAYNIGGAVVAIGRKSVDGVNYTDNNNEQETVFSLKMEF